MLNLVLKLHFSQLRALEKKVRSSRNHLQKLRPQCFGVSTRRIRVGLIDHGHLTHTVGIEDHIFGDGHPRVVDQHLFEIVEIKGIRSCLLVFFV